MEKIVNPQGVYNQAYKVKLNPHGTFQSTQGDYEYQTGDTEAQLRYNSPVVNTNSYNKYYSAKDSTHETVDKSPNLNSQVNDANILIHTSPMSSSLNIEQSERNLEQLDQIMKNLTSLPNYMDDVGNSLSMSKVSRENLIKSSLLFNIENAKSSLLSNIENAKSLRENTTKVESVRKETDITDELIDLSVIRQYYQVYLETIGNSQITHKDLCKNLFEASEIKDIIGSITHLYAHVFTTIYFSSMIINANKSKSRTINHNISVIADCKKMILTNPELEYIVEFLVSEQTNLLAVFDDLATCILLEIFEILGPFNQDYILTQNIQIFKDIIQSHNNLYVRRKCIKFQLHCGFIGLNNIFENLNILC